MLAAAPAPMPKSAPPPPGATFHKRRGAGRVAAMLRAHGETRHDDVIEQNTDVGQKYQTWNAM